MLAAVLSAVLLAAVFRQVDANDVVQVILEKSLSGWILLALLLSLASNIIGYARRWQHLLRSFGYRLQYGTLLYLNLAIDPIVSFIPLRFGEVTRVLYLRNRHGVPISTAAGTIAVDLGLNMAALACLALVGWVMLWTGSLAGGVVAGACSVVAGTAAWALVGRWYAGRFPAPESEFGSLWGKALVFIRAMAVIPPRMLATLVGYSLFLQISEILCVAAIFRAYSVDVGWAELFAYVPVVTFLGRIPVAAGGIGVRESSLLVILGGMAAADKLVGAGLMYSFIELVIPLLLAVPATIHFLATFPIKAAPPEGATGSTGADQVSSKTHNA